MILAVAKETRINEARVAATPDSLKKLLKKGLKVRVEKGAGLKAGFSDADYQKEDIEIVDGRGAIFSSDIIFKIHKPSVEEISLMKPGAYLICLLEPFVQDGIIEKLAGAQVNAFGMELLPRTSRAQSMDILSSQGNIAGYRAVLEAAYHYGRFFGMMMTSAGMAKPARVIVLGAGVAGLQAIATAKRLGAQVEAFDVRKEVKEQILSLGAKFIEIDLNEEGSGTGGYAKELSAESQKLLLEKLALRLKSADIIVSTAAIPGRKAPVLILEETVQSMRTGSVIVDMAAASGGNCALTEVDQVVQKFGVTLVGLTNYPSLIPTDSSAFFGNNLANLLSLMLEKDANQNLRLKIDLADDIVASTLATYEGQVRVMRK